MIAQTHLLAERHPRPGRSTTAADLDVRFDPLFADVTLLLPCLGPDGSHTFTDLKGRTVDNHGSAVISTSDAHPGDSCARFDDRDGYLRVGTAEDWTHLHDGSPFTVEAWVNYRDDSDDNLVILSTGIVPAASGFTFEVYAWNHTVGANFYRGNADSALYYEAAAALTPNRWTHVAFTFSGASKLGTFWFDGRNVGPETPDSEWTWPDFSQQPPAFPLHVGANAAAGRGAYYDGRLSDIRITAGRGRYTGPFLPPSKPLPMRGPWA